MLCLVALITGTTFAQSFSLTENGFINSKDKNNYIVINTSGSQEELYKKAKNYFLTVYLSPKDVISESKPDVITINGIEPDAICKKSMGMILLSFDMNYTITVRFKDGKIRIDSPSFILNDYDGEKPVKLILKGKSNGGLGDTTINCIYNRKGKLKAEYAKEQLEVYFNRYVNSLKKGIENKEKDW